MRFSVDLCSGLDVIINYCIRKKIPLKIGAPPFVCLLPCNSVKITRKRISLVMWVPRVVLMIKIIILTVDVAYLVLRYTPSGLFLNIDNIHKIVNLPASLLGIYTFNIFSLGVIKECLHGDPKRLLGGLLCAQLILFSIIRLIFMFLKGLSVCLRPIIHT